MRDFSNDETQQEYLEDLDNQLDHSIQTLNSGEKIDRALVLRNLYRLQSERVDASEPDIFRGLSRFIG
ncbi:MAG: hypothetical protein AAF576_03465 [Pseudomonadota bacterium]